MRNYTMLEEERKRVISEIFKKCGIIEDAISYLCRSRKCIEENASDMRARVVNDVDMVLGELRKRELQLLRQIDAIETHQLNSIQTTYAKLQNLLGNLKQALNCAETEQDCGSSNQQLIDANVVDAVLKQHTAYVPICYQTNLQELEVLIQNFGLVRGSPISDQGDKGPTMSECLPTEFDDYEDVHQLLYKTLQKLKEEPMISWSSDNLEDWLRHSTTTTTSSTDSYFPLPACFINDDYNYWLKKEPIEVDHPEIWLPEVKQQSSEDSASSIDVISYSEAADSAFDDMGDKVYCCNSNGRGVDIENLDVIACARKETLCREEFDKWLAKGTDQLNLEQSLAGMLRISDICCANEPCRSFDECVCQEKCTQAAFEKRSFLLERLTNNKHVAEDRQNWLRNELDVSLADEKGWLKVNDFNENEKMDYSEKLGPMLIEKTDKPCKSFSDAYDKLPIQTDNQVWTKSVNDPCNCIREDFKSYFQCNNVNLWLSS